MTQSNDLPSRMNRAEDNVIDLRLAVSATLQAINKNSEDIAQLIEVSRRNSEGISALREGTAALQLSQLRTEAALQVFQQHTDAAIERHDALVERLTASNERIEQLARICHSPRSRTTGVVAMHALHKLRQLPLCKPSIEGDLFFGGAIGF